MWFVRAAGLRLLQWTWQDMVGRSEAQGVGHFVWRGGKGQGGAVARYTTKLHGAGRGRMGHKEAGVEVMLPGRVGRGSEGNEWPGVLLEESPYLAGRSKSKYLH